MTAPVFIHLTPGYIVLSDIPNQIVLIGLSETAEVVFCILTAITDHQAHLLEIKVISS